MSDISQKIKELRKINNLTLAQVGAVVGVGKSTVRKWETGQIANMRLDKIGALAEALHTTPGYLMGWDNAPAASLFSHSDSLHMIVGERIKHKRKEIGLSAEQLADALGLSETTVYRYEKGDTRKVSASVLLMCAKILHVSPAYLMGWEDEDGIVADEESIISDDENAPRIGQTAYGQLFLSQQEEPQPRYDDVPSEWQADFTVVCKENSMAPMINEGDLVAVRKQEEPENSKIAVIRINDEIMFRIIKFHEDFVEFRPVNPDCDSIIRKNGEMNDIKIEGQAIGVWHPLK